MELSLKGRGRDLSELVTVFVATVGDAENFRDCLAHLDRQQCRFRFEVIDRVAPMSAAFQAMIDRCRTPFYVQVDEDMLLDPHAIRRLAGDLQAQPDDVALVCYSLWDEHMRRAICGVKIYRHAIMAQCPYRGDVPHCDVEQMERLNRLGFRAVVHWSGFERTENCLGRHGAHYTAATAFEAYYNRAAKSRLDPRSMGWFRWLVPDLFARAQSDPTAVNIYAFLGFAAGMTCDLTKLDHEKDYRQEMPDFKRLQADMDHFNPSEWNLHVTAGCNLACVWCPRQSGGAPCYGDMSPDLVARALDVMPTRAVCIAGFGEPLLHHDLASLIRVCKEREVYVGLITNGLLLEQNADMLAAEKVDHVSVSLNAHTRESFLATAGVDGFQTVLDGVAAAVAKLPLVGVSCVCTRENLPHAGDFLDLAAGLGVDWVDLMNLLPHCGDSFESEGFWSQVLREDDAEAQGLLARLRKHPRADLVNAWPRPISREKCPCRCQSPYLWLSLDPRGCVSPCHRVLPPDPCFGSLDDAVPPWRRSGWYMLRAGLEGDGPLRDECRMCFGNW